MQISGTEESSNSPHACSQLILNRGTKQFSEERRVFPTNDFETIVIQMQNNKPHPIHQILQKLTENGS